MKRSRLSYDEWKCILSKDLTGRSVSTDFFHGYIGLIQIKEVSEAQIWQFQGENITVCDKGLKWLSILPKEDFYCITAMMNEKNDILLWYIDMIAEQGIDSDGVPYFLDLYLDLVVYPDGIIVVDDMEELKDALLKGDITQEQFDLAINTKDKLMTGILSNIDSFIEYTQKCFKMISK